VPTPEDQAKVPDGSWVRMKYIFGLSVLPPESAAIVIRAVNLAASLGDVSRRARWQIIEFWAAQYLQDYETEKKARQVVQEAKAAGLLDEPKPREVPASYRRSR